MMRLVTAAGNDRFCHPRSRVGQSPFGPSDVRHAGNRTDEGFVSEPAYNLLAMDDDISEWKRRLIPVRDLAAAWQRQPLNEGADKPMAGNYIDALTSLPSAT